jgi:SAM-dependent methyltransferase
MTDATCRACGADGVRPFYELPAIPVNSLLLLASVAEAQSFPTAPLELGFCGACGFVQNDRFDPAMTAYNANYEETQGFSPRFREFADSLAQGWVDRYDLHGKRILEVGCGKGEFLASMIEKGHNTGIGYDPVYTPGRLAKSTASKISFITENFGGHNVGIRADALVCRHTLEHIPDVERFMRDLRTVLDGQDTVLLFEIPDVQRILDETAFWDVFYEHCSYFSAGSLARLFERCGFEILDLRRVFDDQYLVIEARVAGSGDSLSADGRALADDLERLIKGVDQFELNISLTRDRWRTQIEDVRAAGGKVVLWGSGSKSVSFLTTMGITDEIEYVVDINPNKHGTFNAGTGQQIVAPEFLVDYGPALVIVMNAVYYDEISANLVELGVETQVQAL